MAKEKSKYEFTGLPIYDIIGKPLVAVARAQSMMAKEQLKSLMESCFHFRNGVYEPILLKMIVTRSAFEPAKGPDKTPALEQITTTFYLPMITIFPINALGIENAELDFSIDITSQYAVDNESETPGNDFHSSNIELIGKISQREKNKRSSIDERNTFEQHERTSSFDIRVEAGTLPLTRGLLEIINIYTNSLQVDKVSEKETPLNK